MSKEVAAVGMCLALASLACTHEPPATHPKVDFVAVAPADFRSPCSGDVLPTRESACPPLPAPTCSASSPVPPPPPGRPAAHGYSLPLGADARATLLLFLGAGGRNSNLEEGLGAQIPDAEKRFGPLLSEIAKPQQFRPMFEQGRYRAWFPDPPLHNVIDAREEQTPLNGCLPYAFRASGFEWIFKCDAKGELGELIVQKDWNAVREGMKP